MEGTGKIRHDNKRKSDTSLPTNTENNKKLAVHNVVQQAPVTIINQSIGNINRLYSWGFGKYGQIGILEYQYSAEPLEIKIKVEEASEENSHNQSNVTISQISCGEFHSAYLTNDGRMYIFGKNTFGQLGLEHNDGGVSPSLVKFPSKIIIEKIACGGEHTLALANNNDLFSWGLNIFGQLGLNSTENKNIPTRVEKFRTLVKNEENSNILKEFIRKQNDNEIIMEIAAGAQHSLIMTSKNYLYSCGFAQNGSLGYFSGKDDPHESNVFTRIQSKHNNKKFIKITCGVNHSGCLLDSNEILVWGRGDNLTIEGIKKVPLPGSKSGEGSVIADFQIGENFFIIRTESGDLYSCGSNEYGQLGVGLQYKYLKTPEKIPINEKIKHISVGYGFVYAVGNSNKVYGWGNNKYGQLLDVNNEKILTPKELINLSNIPPNIVKCGAYHILLSTFSNLQTQAQANKQSGYEKFQKIFDYRMFNLNKCFDPLRYEQEVELLELLESKHKHIEDELIEKEKEIEKLTKVIEEKKKIKIRNELIPNREERNDNLKIINPHELFDEEIRFDDLVFYNNSDVGVGTFGEVKRGYWRKTLVAVKFLKKSMENEEGSIKSFVEELNLLKRLRHPNILLYIGACTTGPNYFLVTEYCENGNLFDFLHTQTKKSQLSNKDRMRIALEIAKGVNYLHSFNPPILHRDLKSLNILLDKNLQVKIADFGWARLRDSHMTKQRGTFQWMAPEVIKKNSYSEKADVFSFAIILWELWVQEPPYKNIDRIQVAKKVATDRNYRPKLVNDIPDEIKNLMVACWDYDPDNRPNFETVIDYLENLEREGKI